MTKKTIYLCMYMCRIYNIYRSEWMEWRWLMIMKIFCAGALVFHTSSFLSHSFFYWNMVRLLGDADEWHTISIVQVAVFYIELTCLSINRTNVSRLICNFFDVPFLVVVALSYKLDDASGKTLSNQLRYILKTSNISNMLKKHTHICNIVWMDNVISTLVATFIH